MSRRALRGFHVACRARGFAVALSRLSRAVDAALLKRAGGALLATGAGCVLACAPGLARADTYTVTKLADTNDGVCDADCSLREAVAAANAHAGADTVNASTVTGTITLAEVPGFNFMEVTDALTIIGPGADLLTVDANTDTSDYGGESRFFSVNNPNADFTIKDLTLANGRTVGHGGAIFSTADLTLDGVTIRDARSATKGGGISVANADVTLTNSTISGCFATTDGGGLYVDNGNLTLNHSAIIGNSVDEIGAGFLVLNGNATLIHSTVRGNTNGSGFWVSSGDVTLTDSTVQSNSGSFAGGFYVGHGSATVTRSTISGNASSGTGGGFRLGYGIGKSATLTHSTVSGNIAFGAGGGFFVFNGGSATVNNSTVSGNFANDSGGGFSLMNGKVMLSHSTVSGNISTDLGGGFYVINPDIEDGVVEVNNSIVANNLASNGFGFVNEFVVSVGRDNTLTVHHSLVSGTSVPVVPAGNGNILGTDPALGPLQNNGGPTFTHALLPGSPAINSGDPAFASPPGPAYDQRGGSFVRVFGGRLDMGSVERQVVPDLIFANGFELQPPS